MDVPSIYYETMGAENGRPLLLIAGLASQLVSWPEEFCRRLAAAGHFVIRFDNRDCGLSAKMEAAGIPDLAALGAAARGGRPVAAPYRLSEMAADAVRLLDRLGLPRAHICGLSMGGMIAQLMAVEHPERVASLISMMSTTSEPDLPGPSEQAAAAMMSTPPWERGAYVRYLVAVYRAFAGGSPAFDAETAADIAARSYDRSFYPEGFGRQMAAIIADGGRRGRLRQVKAPTLVIHGDCDPLLPIEHGRDTAAAVAGARLLLVAGLGHGLAFPALWDELVAAIAAHTRQAS